MRSALEFGCFIAIAEVLLLWFAKLAFLALLAWLGAML